MPTPTVIGLEQSVYMFSEGDGFAVICAAILEPGDPSTIVDPLYQADFIFTTTPDSALGIHQLWQLYILLYVKVQYTNIYAGPMSFFSAFYRR